MDKQCAILVTAGNEFTRSAFATLNDLSAICLIEEYLPFAVTETKRSPERRKRNMCPPCGNEKSALPISQNGDLSLAENSRRSPNLLRSTHAVFSRNGSVLESCKLL